MTSMIVKLFQQLDKLKANNITKTKNFIYH